MTPRDAAAPEARIALLIDADNAPASRIELILAELAKFGVANIRRAYGNWKKSELKGWEAVLHEYAIRPIQQFDHSKGKNATDMVMAIEALDLLYTDRPQVFALVSSDADFTPLVMHLRAKGATVLGFGAQKTPKPFVNACSRFLYLESLGQPAEMVAAPAPAEPTAPPEPAAPAVPAAKKARRKAASAVAAELPPPPAPEPLPAPAAAAIAPQPGNVLRQDARLVSLLRNAVEGASGDDGWSHLGAVGTLIRNQASFDPRNHGYKKLADLIEAIQLFEVRRQGQAVQLRDKRQGRFAGPA
ncbi:NYN domain-containing protein [Azohydromonas aeria]|uniref:NYN domain-containing protein n=1 Tax=Azohydromonas aeria TaxID=2590212 RepID=UPI0012FBAE04|nr:NYN domain-containing protein [Azohydromonas aeria]